MHPSANYGLTCWHTVIYCLQRVAEMVAKGLDYKKEMAKKKAARAAAKAKAAAALAPGN